MCMCVCVCVCVCLCVSGQPYVHVCVCVCMYGKSMCKVLCAQFRKEGERVRAWMQLDDRVVHFFIYMQHTYQQTHTHTRTHTQSHTRRHTHTHTQLHTQTHTHVSTYQMGCACRGCCWVEIDACLPWNGLRMMSSVCMCACMCAFMCACVWRAWIHTCMYVDANQWIIVVHMWVCVWVCVCDVWIHKSTYVDANKWKIVYVCERKSVLGHVPCAY